MKKFNLNTIIILIGLLIFTIFAWAHFSVDINGSDLKEYWDLANNLRTHQSFSYSSIETYNPQVGITTDILPERLQNTLIPCTMRSPGFPFMVAAFQFIFQSPKVIYAIIFLSFIGICLYAKVIGRLLFKNPITQSIFLALTILSPVYLTRASSGIDILATFFLTAFIAHWIPNDSDEKNATTLFQIFLTAFWGLCAIYTRFNLLAFVIPLVIFGLIRAIKIRKSIITHILILILVVCGIIPWALRHKTLTDHFGLSNQGGIVLYHIFIDSQEKEEAPPKPFSTEQRKEFLIEQFDLGKSINQAESALNQKLNEVTMNELDKDPTRALITFSNNLRTFFFFSYYDISEAIMAIAYKTLSLLNINTNVYSTLNQTVKPILFQISRWFKILLTLSFLTFPFMINKKNSLFNNSSIMICLFLATLIATLATGIFTGAAGDRMRMPFNIINILCLIQFLFMITHPLCPKLKEKA